MDLYYSKTQRSEAVSRGSTRVPGNHGARTRPTGRTAARPGSTGFIAGGAVAAAATLLLMRPGSDLSTDEPPVTQWPTSASAMLALLQERLA